MEKAGQLLVQYQIPLNDDMQKTIKKTIESDNIVQWLASTELKRD